jgi:hypothetical protein
MTEDKKICAYCGNEIGTTRTDKYGGTMLNMHIEADGMIRKCYTERKRPWSWIFGKKNYKGVKAWYQTGPIKIKPIKIEPFIGISFDKEVRKWRAKRKRPAKHVSTVDKK